MPFYLYIFCTVVLMIYSFYFDFSFNRRLISSWPMKRMEHLDYLSRLFDALAPISGHLFFNLEEHLHPDFEPCEAVLNAWRLACWSYQARAALLP